MKTYDIIVAGGSIGGVMAAYAACSEGKTVLLTENTDWIGGQLTNQGVPSDEHDWIEKFGASKTYHDYRKKVRDYYKNHPFIKAEYKDKHIFNPGDGWVSDIAHEPKLALHLFHEMLMPFETNETLTIELNTTLKSVKTVNETLKSATFQKRDGSLFEAQAKYFIDATDTGEMLPLSGTDYVSGAEGDIYGEPHAYEKAEPTDMQPITWVGAVSFHEGEKHPMEKPEQYDHFRSIIMPYEKPLLSWFGPTLDVSSKARKFRMEGSFDPEKNPHPPLFTYRQFINKNLYKNDYKINDATLINWPQNDYVFGNIFDDDKAEHHQYMAKQLTLSLIYWLKTEAPRDEGGVGYPELKLRGDLLGTEDGLAKAPYIRESRRMKTAYIVKEQDISAKINDQLPTYWDSVGVGCYHIDLHMTTKTKEYFFENTWPFEIPLGSFISTNTSNLIPGCKNIGTTHITNGCFRLHPVEWNIGEVAGYLATYCINHNLSPQTLYADQSKVKAFQRYLETKGIQRHWPKDEVHAI